MAGQTTRFGLTTLDSPTDTLGIQGYKFVDVDRRRLDALLTYAEYHQHTGQVAGSSASPEPPHLRLTSSGRIPANTAAYYRFGIVDSTGQEQVGSRIASLITRPPLTIPQPPTLRAVTGGTLVLGTYTYGVSAYMPTSAYETPISSLTSVSADGSVEVTFVTPPDGATGLNLYRKGPMDAVPYFLQPIPAGTTTYLDDGLLPTDTLRAAPIANTSCSVNSVVVTSPRVLVAGESWRVYRTFDLENWYGTLISWNAGQDVTDTGFVGGSKGSPLTDSAAVGGPPKIDLAAETVGIPIVPTREVAEFAFPGPTGTAVSAWQWVNEFGSAKVLGVRASLGMNSMATGQEVSAILEYLSATGWMPYTQRASIPVGSSVGPFVPFAQDATTLLSAGAALRAVVDQGGGTTSADLLVSVSLECLA